MKHSFLICVFLLSGVVAAAHAKTAKNDASCYQSNELRQTVVAYGDAVNDMTAASLTFGGDTETKWAIDTVNTIWTRCKSKPFDFLPYMTEITMMQSYFAYGVTYVPLMLYWSKHYQEILDGDYTFKSFYDDCRDTKDSLYHILQQKPDWQGYFFMSTTVYSLQDIYFGLVNDLDERDSEPQFAALKMSPFIDSVYAASAGNPEYYAWKIDGTIFFITYFQWILNTIDKSQDNEALINEIRAYADVFDNYTNPVVGAVIDRQPLPVQTASDNKDYLLKTLPIRTKMLRMLENNFKSYNNE